MYFFPSGCRLPTVSPANQTMNFLTCIIGLFAALLGASAGASGKDTGNAAAERYSEVLIHTSSADDLRMLQLNDIPVDHYGRSPARGISVVLNQDEVQRLGQTGLHFDVVTQDMRSEYHGRETPDARELAVSRAMALSDHVTGFELGSMGGFYTLEEIASELDSMYLLYPGIISERVSLGQSHEGRDIWMVKISDNPNQNESDTEPTVYYDALHHAREPGSMMTTMYFMYWLLENYGTDPRATYLVDNRELYFVPLVNPDGYYYNEQTDPNGGGFWRKNRRVSGGGCFGVDLNRNYSFGWGYDSGSSPDPCSTTYRGPSAFSEPETQAIRDFLATISPAIAFSTHTYGDRFLNPYGYSDEAPSYEIYSEFSSDFVAGSSALYGITSEMLGYHSSGTTRDYLHSEGTVAWTPELGADGFWPPVPTIIPTASENRPRFEYIAWVAGAFADFKNIRFTGTGFVSPGDTLGFTVGIRNRGLTQEATAVHVSVSTPYDRATALSDQFDYPPLAAGTVEHNTANPFRFLLSESAVAFDQMPLIISVTQEGIETARDTVMYKVGTGAVLAGDDAENGSPSWQSSGAGLSWDTSFVDFYDGAAAFADSRYGNSANNTSTLFTLLVPVSLTDAVHPVMTFAAKWSIEQTYDYARVQLSTNGGVTWLNLAGRYTTLVGGQPSYTGTRHWIQEEIDLSPYAGSEIMVGFSYHTDGGVPGDGFYFDNFAIINFGDSGTSSIDQPLTVTLEPVLFQNQPNPFNPSTLIRYQVPVTGTVDLRVFDLLGREVTTLVNEIRAPGVHTAVWDGTDHRLVRVPAGVYFYRFSTNGHVETRKMILQK